MSQVRLMEESAESPADAVRKSIPLFHRNVMLDDVCWPCKGGAFVWVTFTPDMDRQLCGEPVEEPAEYVFDYQYARAWALDERPPNTEFHAAPRGWLRA